MRLVKVRTGRRVTSWVLYVGGEERGEWATLGEAKRGAKEITSLRETGSLASEE
jgi:hypothetical protein